MTNFLLICLLAISSASQKVVNYRQEEKKILDQVRIFLLEIFRCNVDHSKRFIGSKIQDLLPRKLLSPFFSLSISFEKKNIMTSIICRKTQDKFLKNIQFSKRKSFLDPFPGHLRRPHPAKRKHDKRSRRW